MLMDDKSYLLNHSMRTDEIIAVIAQGEETQKPQFSTIKHSLEIIFQNISGYLIEVIFELIQELKKNYHPLRYHCVGIKWVSKIHEVFINHWLNYTSQELRINGIDH